VVADAREEPPLHPGYAALVEAGLFSVIRVPLVVHETVRGAVALWGAGTGRFDAEDAELLATLARPLALALEKASALESLAESELKYRSLVAQAEEMILTVDAQSRRILDANPFAARVLGYGPRELQGLRLDDISMADEAELAAFVARIHADGEVHLGDVRYRKRDGSPLDVEVVASLVTYGGREAVLVLARDVSERKALMAQLMQSQKMESLGTMAGAVAHDFNNLLTTILGFASLVKRSPNLDPDERENVALIEEAARKAADLTGRLLAFARGGLVRFGQVDLRTVVEDTLQLVAPAIHSRITLRVDLPTTPVLVEGDHGQLQQALTNIVLNARDVMPDGGTIDIRAGTTGPLAWVEIADTGPGMTDDVRMRIFEPFFTTKPPGSGTGLGMAITYGIVQGHHGDITVDSEPGRGTTFTLSFPLLTTGAAGGRADGFNAGEGNLILVVDDDAMARRAMAATLGELGYNVVEAPGGATAVEIVRARPDRFAAVLLDLVMPGMTGAETFRALTAIRGDLPVIVCTGYAPDSHIDTDAKRRIAGLIQKPFTAERLARALEAAGARPVGRR
jgi:PAS domain S-box-containing protein